MTEPPKEPQAVEQPSAAPNGATTAETESLRARAEAAERERDQYVALLKSTRAELENDLKRARRSFEEEKKYAHSGLALGLLSVLDNFERAIAAAKQANEGGSLAQGVTLIEGQLRDLMQRHGITRIEAEGKPFDPSRHQALLQQPSKDHEPFTVLNVLQQGYMIHDRVLRPANVAVSVAPAEEQKDNGENA